MSNNLGRRWPKGQLYPYERRVDFFRSLGSRALSNHRPASFSAACVGVHHGQRIDARAVAGAKPFLEISTPEAVEPSRRQQRFAVGRSKCVCNTANPECKSGDDSVCSWAIKDIDCPDNGCFAFGITLPKTFGTDQARPPAPLPFTKDPNYGNDWNIPFKWQGIDAGAQCTYSGPPHNLVERRAF